ncbi:MAG: sodium:proton exchanger [Campylobacterales bacterium]|nr:sodium:proton exchanger [Campylobacterales bacterium]
MSSDYEQSRLGEFFNNYWDIGGGLIFGLLAFFAHKNGSAYLATFFSALSIASLSVTVSEVAEILAEKLEEPYGSFVLTFSAVAVEILLLFMILLESANNPQALETVKGGIISAVIVDMNVLLGLAVFIGGLSFKQQEHNSETSNTYVTILLVSSIALLVPSVLTYTEHGKNDILQASFIIAFLMLLFYSTIFIFQTKTHTHFFKATARSRILRYKRKMNEHDEDEHTNYVFEKLPIWVNFSNIFGLIFIIGLMAEIFAKDGTLFFNDFGVSIGLVGLLIAIISVAPEIFTALKAAKNDQIQRVINIAMGASTVSILLTVPILMILAYIVGIELPLDFNALQVGALILTVILAWKTTDNGETNYFEGISHLMFFLCYAIITALY